MSTLSSAVAARFEQTRNINNKRADDPCVEIGFGGNLDQFKKSITVRNVTERA